MPHSFNNCLLAFVVVCIRLLTDSYAYKWLGAISGKHDMDIKIVWIYYNLCAWFYGMHQESLLAM